jgi:hypothetical protein
VIEIQRLFKGKDQKQRFLHKLNTLLSLFSKNELLTIFGVSQDDSRNSLKSPRISLLLSIVDGINLCAVYIRAGCSLGNNQDRYIMGGPGADDDHHCVHLTWDQKLL